MDADACFIFLYDKKKDDLVLAATNGLQEAAIGNARIALGEGLEGWVGRRLEPLMLKEFHADARTRQIAGLDLADYVSSYCLPLYVYSNATLVGIIEVFYQKAKTFTDEEINFFTTLSGIISTTVQNEQMQVELNRMNKELEQWVAEKSEELRASEERYRTLVENASESIFVLAQNGDIIFANEQATRLTGYAKYDLLHKNLYELFVSTAPSREFLDGIMSGKRSIVSGELQRTDGTRVPVEMNATGLTLMGRRFVQSVVRDITSAVRFERLLLEKKHELAALKAKAGCQ
jgi:PAS domain S-box-containing protein